ncbi:uncharacterized protein LOC126659459 [Mercurialis annua]|uniref:uncharacterized protein LOC126659459 n=1 Tax=Mercurialis annua TaxID=3986 RepID=UPI00216072B8|nr:uncharacterized protein LOC126659459 [Mercurialis annua]
MATHRKMDSEDQETILFHSYPPCPYYVQSPSTVSHANSSDLKTQINTLESTFHSPSRSDTAILLNKNPEASRFTLSHYSSSRGSNNSFLTEKKINGDHENGVNRLIIIDGHGNGKGDEDDDEYYYARENGLWWRFCSFKRSSSCGWIFLQLSWRLLVSLGVALLVFYIATKPPPPHMSIKMAGMREFGLGEGIDGTGVTTNILTCNFSINLLIDNKSKLFGLHIHPPLLQLFFNRLPLAMSRGSKLYGESQSRTLFQLNVGTRNKPLYGAGRNMEDMLESGNGLPILIRVKLSSHYRVLSNFIRPEFHHQAQCLVVLDSKFDKKHPTQAFNSTCTFS